VAYRQWVRQVVTRYRFSPTILAWQLLNEAEDAASDGSCPADASAVLKTWAADVSGLIKSIDRNHLVSLGTIGSGQCGASFTEYKDLHSLPTIDLCEFHDYGAQPDAG
jgi:mannan endo-1,4-beta-mannosidase